ncbi:flagellar motor protein MotB [Oceaniglobus indicus]|uniref:flagellar motor protein MotB n=1 Tax=Oceaniglobus indicus TaxID=2047749 RepID=UPI000C17BBEB|nr:flagellar motor protein MotB [Oceaniglobus indicus]
MTTARANAPIIIKRKKIVGGGGHHGGAWKVAYADFVTAMMAFFMLMWLLNATTETQRKGLADYFSPTISVSRVSGGGEGSFGGDSVQSEMTMIKNGSGAAQDKHTEEDKAAGQSGVSATNAGDGQGDPGADETAMMAALADRLSGRAGESMVSEDLARHIVTRITDVGLIVELFDLPGVALFAEGTATPLPLMTELVAVVGDVFMLTDNRIAINGHVRSEPLVRRDNPVWDRSSDRARAAHDLLQAGPVPDARVHRVTGLADRERVTANPMAVRNNRIELILLREGK